MNSNECEHKLGINHIRKLSSDRGYALVIIHECLKCGWLYVQVIDRDYE